MKIPVLPEVLRIRKLQDVVPPVVMNYLLPHEKNIITVRRHPGIFISHICLLACCCATATVLTAMTDGSALTLGAVWAVCIAIFLWLIMRAVAWRSTYFVATEIRLIIIGGLIRRKATTVPLREISEVGMNRSLLGQIAGYGEILTLAARPNYKIPKIKYMPYTQQLFFEILGLLHPDGADDGWP